MHSNRIITILTIILVSIAIFNNLLLLWNAKEITGNAIMGTTSICFSESVPFDISTNCDSVYDETETISCTFFSTRIGTTFFTNSPTNFLNLEVTGDVNKELDPLYIGNYTEIISAVDSLGCKEIKEYNSVSGVYKNTKYIKVFIFLSST